MAARGSIAKVNVTETIKDAFGADFVGVSNGKMYVWANDGGERVQIALAMTCPKTPFGDTPAEEPHIFSATAPNKIDELMSKLGITED